MARCNLSVLTDRMGNIVFILLLWGAMNGLFNFAIAEEQAGLTIMAKGKVTASQQQAQRDLVRRSPVYSVDMVSTSQLSATQLRMKDGGLLALQASSEIAIAAYQYNPQNRQGTVNMSLLKGGLRTITGALQQTSDNYKLVTPVASIGVRGTHYEAEMIEDDLFLSAWEGIIDVDVTAGIAAQKFSLGPNLAYRFALVKADGSVEFFITVPSVFSAGHSSELYDQQRQQSEPVVPQIQLAKVLPSNMVKETVGETLPFVNSQDTQFQFDNDRFVSDWLPDFSAEGSRVGEVVFDSVAQQSIVSSLGQVTDFTMSMAVNFDNSQIPTGNLSFSDSGGEWFAAFNGLVADGTLNLSVNFASHGNNLADGTIEGLLVDQSQGVLGTIALSESLSTNVFAGGSFELRQSAP